MRTSLRKIILGTAIGIASIGIYLGTNRNSTIKEVTLKPFYSETFNNVTDPRLEQVRKGTNEDKQKYLDEIFELTKPKNIEKIIYDPNFTESDNYLREQLKKDFSNKVIEDYILRTHKDSQGHNMCVIGTINTTGNGKKRPVFARATLYASENIKISEDVKSALRHEDTHADEEMKGFDFGTTRKNGAELTKLFSNHEIRADVICAIGELDAYASQYEAIENKIDNPSIECIEKITSYVYNYKKIINNGLENNTLTPIERAYAEHKLKTHKKVLDKL